MSDKQYDAVVVGSGASGSFAARELTAQGLDVLMLEAGRKVSARDFDLSLRPKRPRPINILERALAMLGGRHIQSRSMFYRGMLQGLYANDRDNPYTTPKDAPFVWIKGRQEGGRMHLFGRVLMRWSDDDFKCRSRTGRGVDWPISYDDLAPYYAEAETCLGLYGNEDGLPMNPDGVYVGAQSLSPGETHFKSAIESRWPERHVIAWRSVVPPKSRVYRPLEDALATGRLTIRYHSVAKRVLAEGNRATGVEIVDAETGEVSIVRAKHVVLCASPIESVRLMLNSADANHPRGLGNSSGLLGRYFMDQLPLLCMGAYHPVRGHSSEDSQPRDPFYQNGGGIFITRFDDQGDPASRGDFDFQGSVGRAPTDKPDDPAKLMFFGFGQMQPDADNRITLDPKRTDRWGIPVPHIRCKMSRADLDLLVRQEETLLETVNGVGGEVEFLGSPRGIREWGRGIYHNASRIERFLFKKFFPMVMQMGAAIHECGGARMGTDPKNSVLNQWGQSWDLPNLYVTDASAFAGSGVTGTTLTIMAQSIRACRHLAEATRRGSAGT